MNTEEPTNNPPQTTPNSTGAPETPPVPPLPPIVPPPPPPPDGVLQKLQCLEQAVARLEAALPKVDQMTETAQKALAVLEDRMNLDRARELAVDKMSKELAGFRQKGAEHAKKQTLQNLVVLFDHFEEAERQVGDAARKQIEWLRECLQETLYREDLEIISDAPKRVDRAFHKVIKTIPTDNPDLDATVAEVLRKGFRWHGEMFRPEQVSAYRYQAPPAPTARSESQSPTAPAPPPKT